MKVQIKENKTVEVKFLAVDAIPFNWRDAEVNGMDDFDGSLIPCREGDSWKPLINIDNGQITNWVKGIIAEINYEVLDQGIYKLIDEKGNCIASIADYVPDALSPDGDYMCIDIDKDGFIKDWTPDKIKGIIDEAKANNLFF